MTSSFRRSNTLLLFLLLVLKVYSQNDNIDSVPVITLHANKTGLSSIAFSSDGKLLAAGGVDKKIYIWDTRTWKLLRKLTGHQYEVHSLAFNTDGTCLISASPDNTIRTWNTKTGKQLRSTTVPNGKSFSGHLFDIKQLNDSIFITGSNIGFVFAYHYPTGALTKKSDALGATVHSIAISHRYHHIYYSGPFTILNINRFERVRRINGISGIGAIDAFPGDTEMVVSTNSDGYTFLVKDVSHPIVDTILLKTPYTYFDRVTGKTVNSFDLYPNTAVKFSPTGTHLTIAGYIPTIYIWSITEKKTVGEKKGHAKSITAISYSPDGKHLASVSLDGTLKVWNNNIPN